MWFFFNAPHSLHFDSISASWSYTSLFGIKQKPWVIRLSISDVFRLISPSEKSIINLFMMGHYLFLTHNPPLSLHRLVFHHLFTSLHSPSIISSAFLLLLPPLILSIFLNFLPRQLPGSSVSVSPGCHLFILPCWLLRFPSILLHLWLFFLTVHRSVFLPPLGGNGKSDISYLVNGERWRVRERDRRWNKGQKGQKNGKQRSEEWQWEWL